MEIILHAHHADVSDSLRTQAEQAMQRLASRVTSAVKALVRFVGDGSTRRVEIVLRSARHGELFAQADARAFAPALAVAVQRLEAQVVRSRRSRRSRGRAQGGFSDGGNAG